MEKRSKDEFLQKSDVETIIEVNKKAIELQTETSDQYEEMIDHAHEMKKLQEKNSEDIAEIKKEVKDINKTQFKILLLLSSGIISLIVQIAVLLKK